MRRRAAERRSGGVGAETRRHTLERVEITGSNIRRINAETASPVQTLTREDIEKSGKSSVAECLQTLSVDNQGSVPKNFGARLRVGRIGHLAARPRRRVDAGAAERPAHRAARPRRRRPEGFSDLNLIPLEAVERVEILKDGGSAIYGSDAIAGVVNIILRSDYRGLALNASYGTTPVLERQREARRAHRRLRRPADAGLQRPRQPRGRPPGRDLQPRHHRSRPHRRADLRDHGLQPPNETAAGSPPAATARSRPTARPAARINGNVRNPATLDYYNRGNLAGVGFTQHVPRRRVLQLHQPSAGRPGRRLPDRRRRRTISQIQPRRSTSTSSRAARSTSCRRCRATRSSTGTTTRTRPSRRPRQVSIVGGLSRRPGEQRRCRARRRASRQPVLRHRQRASAISPSTSVRGCSNGESDFYRALVGHQGHRRGLGLRHRAAVLGDQGTDVRHGFLQRDVAFALLNPTPANVAAATAGSAAVRRVAARDVLAHRRKRRPEFAGALRGAVAADHADSLVQDHPDRRQGVARADAAAGRPARHRRRRRAAPRERSSLTPVTGTERGNVIGLGYSAYDGAPHHRRRLRRAARAGAEAARGHRRRSATTTTPTPAARRRPSSASSTRRSASWRCAAPTRAASARRARPRTASAAWRRSRPPPIRCAATSASRRPARAGAVAVDHVAEPGAEAREVRQLHARPGVRADLEDQHRARLLRHHAQGRDQPGADQRGDRRRPRRARSDDRDRRSPAIPARCSRCSASTSTRRGPRCAASTSTPSRASTSAAGSAS